MAITPSTSVANSTQESNTSLVSTSSDVIIFQTTPQKGRKRKKKQAEWKRNILKRKRNSGESYTTTKDKIKPEKKVKKGCTDKCKLKCMQKFTARDRCDLLSQYWNLGNLERQRTFISSSMESVEPKYKYARVDAPPSKRKPRSSNTAFFLLKDGQKIRVCKLFFKSTLDINDRIINTVKSKEKKIAGLLLESDKRGKHGKHKRVGEDIKQAMRAHINFIPKIESHYTRANTSRQYICGSRSISDIYQDYAENCKENNTTFGKFHLFYKIFTEEFNLSFFTPKKDQCDLCATFENTSIEQRSAKLIDKYDTHLKEKDLSRVEKRTDKENADTDAIVAVYDLLAVVQLPKSNVSTFYYKSKLNVLNLTIYDLKTNNCNCYVWDESNAHRGVNEIGTCVMKYLKDRNDCAKNQDVIFYSDNCAGQQKNKFMLSLYIFLIVNLNFNTITHKFLISGHSQNEGDSAHSLIERKMKKQLKGGPMFTPESFISCIRGARKRGDTPFHVTELSHDEIHDMKELAKDIGPINMPNTVKMSEIKVMQVKKEDPTKLYYKTSFEKTEYSSVTVIKKKRTENIERVELKPAFLQRPGLADHKKKDLILLLNNNKIPNYYRSYYENL